MPTPIVNFRLSHAERETLHLIAKIYGAATTSDFLRDMVGAMCSGDVERINAFNSRLALKMGQQMDLKFAEAAASSGSVREVREVREVRSSRVKRKPRKRGRARGRTT